MHKMTRLASKLRQIHGDVRAVALSWMSRGSTTRRETNHLRLVGEIMR